MNELGSGCHKNLAFKFTETFAGCFDAFKHRSVWRPLILDLKFTEGPAPVSFGPGPASLILSE